MDKRPTFPRTQTDSMDAVHPRFLKSKSSQGSERTEEAAYCPSCNVRIQNTSSALRSHFQNQNVPHECKPCVYCRGPVYKYFLGNETYFHECNKNATQGENNSDNDASSVSEENDSDVDEGRSTTTNDTSILSSDRNSDALNVSDVSNYESM